MAASTIRFHGSLNDFLAPRKRGLRLTVTVDAPAGVVDLIQALGVPHPEVDLIVANGRPVGLGYRAAGGDVIDVFGLDRGTAAAGAGAGRRIAPATGPGLIPRAPDPPRFVLDGHLGRLARYLRMLGFESVYDPHAEDAELARTSADGHLILLTRDRGLLKRSIVKLGYLVRDDDPRRQLDEVVARYGLADRARPFTRCLRCNGAIRQIPKAQVAEQLAGEPRTLRYFDSFGRCDGCGAIYWPGSHFDRMSLVVRDVLAPATEVDPR